MRLVEHEVSGIVAKAKLQVTIVLHKQGRPEAVMARGAVKGAVQGGVQGAVQGAVQRAVLLFPCWEPRVPTFRNRKFFAW